MSPYLNLPLEQRFIQGIVDQFNANERLWKKLEPKRRLRRKLRPRLSRKKLKDLALLSSPKARPPLDCISADLIEP